MREMLYFCAGLLPSGKLETVQVSAVAPRLAFFDDREKAWVQASARCLHVFRFEVDEAGSLVPGSIWTSVGNDECAVKSATVFITSLFELGALIRDALAKGGVQCV